jgi:hypothetical protein
MIAEPPASFLARIEELQTIKARLVDENGHSEEEVNRLKLLV